MSYQIPPKLAMINDISGFGHCSAAVSIPIISIRRVQVCPVPTALFSNHMGFPTYYYQDCTEQMPAYLNAWDKLGLRFDGIYSGFLSSERQLQITADFITAQRNAATNASMSDNAGTASGKAHSAPLVIVDPVMGDHGRAYSIVTDAFCISMRKLVAMADIITPNITEACLLTDTPFKESSWESSELTALTERLHAMGPSKIVITGIRDNSRIMNFYYEEAASCAAYTVEPAGEARPGTGDIFASIIAADALRQLPFADAVHNAADFVRLCMQASCEAGMPVAEGVCLENCLDALAEK